VLTAKTISCCPALLYSRHCPEAIKLGNGKHLPRKNFMAGQKIQIKVTDDELKGRFANMANVSHQEDHFLMDFYLVAPPAGQLVARIATSPGHMKALANAINEQLKKYEDNFGKIEASNPPAEDNQIGFRPN